MPSGTADSCARHSPPPRSIIPTSSPSTRSARMRGRPTLRWSWWTGRRSTGCWPQAPLPVATALDYAVQIASALAGAHASGIIHRDIKPANIVITRDGRAKVLDFGLAKLIERGPTEATITGAATEPGLIMGTAAYMSPEQAEGRLVDARSDIFSFGAVLYEMLAGRRPFSGSTHVGVITSILRDQPAPVRTTRPDAPADVDAIIQRALAKDPAARYQDASALRADLVAAHAKLTRPAEAGWRRPAVLVPVVVLLLAVAGFSVWQLMQAREAQRVRRETIPQIEKLQSDRSFARGRAARRPGRPIRPRGDPTHPRDLVRPRHRNDPRWR